MTFAWCFLISYVSAGLPIAILTLVFNYKFFSKVHSDLNSEVYKTGR